MQPPCALRIRSPAEQWDVTEWFEALVTPNKLYVNVDTCCFHMCDPSNDFPQLRRSWKTAVAAYALPWAKRGHVITLMENDWSEKSRDFVRIASHWFFVSHSIKSWNFLLKKKKLISDADRFVIQIINIRQQVEIDFFSFSGAEQPNLTGGNTFNKCEHLTSDFFS